MKVTFIAQASILIETSDCTIWTDPWLFGTAFNDSWGLFPQAHWTPDMYDRVDFLWVSHEHPDHFHFPTLKAMPMEFKERVQLLFQKNNTDKMPNAFRKLGFKNIQLLENRKVTQITPNTKVHNSQIGQMDSSLAVIDHDGYTLLNLNDCEVNSTDCKHYLKDLGHVDLVFNQFSMAGYNGHIDYEKHLPQIGEQILQNMLENHRDLGAKVSVPFASNVYFCCDDNKHINNFANTPWQVYERFQQEGLGCEILYVGDTYDSATQSADTQNALQRYQTLYANKDKLAFDAGPLIPLEEVQAAFQKRHLQLKEKFPAMILRRLGQVTIKIPDLKKRVRMSLYSGEFTILEDSDDFDLMIRSQPLHFALSTTWGVQTLGVSARYFIKQNFATWRWYRIITSLNNAEMYLKPKYLFTKTNFDFLRSRLSGGFNQLSYQLRRMKPE